MRNARYVGVNEKGHMTFGNCDTVKLAEEFGTPLYVMSEDEVRTRCKEIKGYLTQKYPNSKVLYASKAFACKEIYRILKDEDMGVDVVSGGEFYTAMVAGFPVDKIYFHGNNKTVEELEFTIENNIGTIVVDSLNELQNIQMVASSKNKVVNVLLRISPGISGHTHEFISTGQIDSKFGFPIEYGIAMDVVGETLKKENINFKGIHCHIGSQMFGSDVYNTGVEVMTNLILDIKNKYGVECEELNIGGGFGVYYTEEDEPIAIAEFVDVIVDSVKANFAKNELKLPTIVVEPGRWLVGESGITLYKIGAIKEIPTIRTYVSIDGGMTDNIRPALYQAKYEGVVANKVNEECSQTVTIAGKCCESGDILIHDLMVPNVETGDILAILTTGAYGYSMASNYNKALKPAVVMVKGEQARVVVKRETYEDLVRNDI